MCDIDMFDERADAWHETTPKARKRHRCDCCHGTIEPGEKYVRHWHVYDGEVQAGKMCPTCVDDRETFAKEHEGALFGPGDFLTVLEECVDDGDPDDQRWNPIINRIRKTRSAEAASSPTG